MPCINEDGKKLYCDSYKDVVQQLAVKQPFLTQHDIRVEAARIFRPRYRIDKKSEKTEIAGLPDYEGIPFSLTPNGEVFFPSYGPDGKVLEEVHLSQLRQRPYEYSSKDHQTSLLIQRAFQEGATKVRTVYGREGDDYRDIVEMDYDPVTNQGLLKVKNTEQNGELQSFSEIRTIAKRTNPHLAEVMPADNIFILTDKLLRTNDAKRTINSGQGIISTRKDQGQVLTSTNFLYSQRQKKEQLVVSTNRNNKKAEERRFPDPDMAMVRNTQLISTKPLKDTRNTLVTTGVILLERLRKKQREKKAEKKNLREVQKPESLFVRVWNKLVQKPKEVVIKRKENMISPVSEQRASVVTERRSIRNKLLGVVEKAAQVIKQPKKVVESFVAQVKRIPDKVAGILQEKKALIIKNIDTSIRPPLLEIKERVVHAFISLKEKAFSALQLLKARKFDQKEKPRLFPTEMKKEQQGRMVRRISVLIFHTQEKLVRIKRFINRVPQVLWRFSNKGTHIELSSKSPQVARLKRSVGQEVVNQMERRVVRPVRNWYKRIIKTFLQIRFSKIIKKPVKSEQLIPEIMVKVEKKVTFSSLFWIWLLWQRWLRFESYLKVERPQGLAFGSPRSHRPAQHVKGVIYSVEMSRLRGSVSVA